MREASVYTGHLAYHPVNLGVVKGHRKLLTLGNTDTIEGTHQRLLHLSLSDQNIGTLKTRGVSENPKSLGATAFGPIEGGVEEVVALPTATETTEEISSSPTEKRRRKRHDVCHVDTDLVLFLTLNSYLSSIQ